MLHRLAEVVRTIGGRGLPPSSLASVSVRPEAVVAVTLRKRPLGDRWAVAGIAAMRSPWPFHKVWACQRRAP